MAVRLPRTYEVGGGITSRKYRWTAWFKRGEVTLVRGKHYDRDWNTMRSQIHKAAKRWGGTVEVLHTWGPPEKVHLRFTPAGSSEQAAP